MTPSMESMASLLDGNDHAGNPVQLKAPLPPLEGPLHRLDPAARRARLERYVGRFVKVTYEPYRARTAEPRVIRSYLVTLARPVAGSQADLAVLKLPAHEAQALSLATIISIETWEAGGLVYPDR